MGESTSIGQIDGDRQNISFITLLRAIASMLVVWCHLVAGWTIHHQVTFTPLALTRPYLIQPLAIIEDFGFLGVAMFFFVSGFIITHVAQRESPIAFLTKRVLRIYPPLMVSIVLVAVLLNFCVDPLDELGQMGHRSWGDFLRAITLVNYFWQDNHYMNGVAWTLVIEVIFYTLCLIALPLIKSSAMTVTLLMSALCWTAVLRSHDLGDHFGAISVSLGLIPLLLIGQSTYWIWSGRIRFWQFALLFAVNWFVFACAIGSLYVVQLPADNSYGVSAMYAYFIFIVAMLANQQLRLPKVLKFYATISYSLYLLHVPIGESLLTWLCPKVGFGWAIGPVFGVVTLASYLCWRFLEQPSQTAARKLLGYIKANPLAGPFQLRYSIGVAIIFISASACILIVHPQERVPLTAFLMPGQLYPAATTTPAENPAATALLTIPTDVVSSTRIDGNFDAADQNTLSGWAWDAQHPNQPVTVEISIDGMPLGCAIADRFRDDLLAAGIGNGQHGFLVLSPDALKDGKPHSISITFLGTTKQITSSPRIVGGTGQN